MNYQMKDMLVQKSYMNLYKDESDMNAQNQINSIFYILFIWNERRKFICIITLMTRKMNFMISIK